MGVTIDWKLTVYIYLSLLFNIFTPFAFFQNLTEYSAINKKKKTKNKTEFVLQTKLDKSV